MQRYEDGDSTALNKVQGMYIDSVDLPKNYAELYDAVSKADLVFEQMPATIKSKFNNNAAEFWKNYGKDEFDDLLNSYREETFNRYGLTDNNPVKTVEKSSSDSEPIKITDPVQPVKEVSNVEKSE